MASLDYTSVFLDNMPGGAFVCNAHGDHELLFVNDNLIELFECADRDEFMEFVGGRFEGIARETSISVIIKEVRLQIEEADHSSGYIFYNIRTKKDNVRRVVNHWALLRDTEDGDVIYGTVYPHRIDNSGTDFDTITGLYSKRKFHKQIAHEIRKSKGDDRTDQAIVYLNLVNFKLLNIDRGVAEGDVCLKVMADTLLEVFDDAVISRLSDDHFAVYTRYENVLQKTEETERRFCETYGNRFDVIGKFGIYRFTPDKDFDVETALSHAKVACDFIKYDVKTDIVEYSDSLARKIKTQEYVIGKIDEAIKKEWIKVYYQPVIRSITGCLC